MLKTPKVRKNLKNKKKTLLPTVATGKVSAYVMAQLDRVAQILSTKRSPLRPECSRHPFRGSMDPWRRALGNSTARQRRAEVDAGWNMRISRSMDTGHGVSA